MSGRRNVRESVREGGRDHHHHHIYHHHCLKKDDAKLCMCDDLNLVIRLQILTNFTKINFSKLLNLCCNIYS